MDEDGADKYFDLQLQHKLQTDRRTDRHIKPNIIKRNVNKHHKK